MKKNVLVFPCGSEVGLELHKSLAYSTHFNLFGGSSVKDHGEFVYKNYIADIPFVDDPQFVEKLNEIIDRHTIDFIFPAHDDVVLKLAQAQAKGNLRCTVVTSPYETCEIARSKLKTYKTFQGIIPVPKVYASETQVPAESYPIFLKPDAAQGSKGVHLAKDHVKAEFYLRENPDLLILEYLPGREYTIDCFTDKNGKLLFSEGRQRIRISNGISVNSATEADNRFAELAQKINAKLELNGPWFFQVKESAAGDLVLMEIAPRIAGTMGLVRCKGVNLALLSLFNALGYPVELVENTYNMVIDRALVNSYRHDIQYEHVYLDFDDTVVFNGQINPQVMAFVYQCINKGVKVHLITKHQKKLDDTLKHHRLDTMFDELIWIGHDEEKVPHITEKNAIFIDDSFAERKAVFEKLKIPVFDSHMLESLMEAFN